MTKQRRIRRNKNQWKVNVATAIAAFFLVFGVYSAVGAVAEALPDRPEPQPIVVEYDYHDRVVAHYEGHLVGFIMQQGFSYQEALTLADEAKEDNGLSTFKVEEGTILWLPTRENR